jgi:hypothetical protein
MATSFSGGGSRSTQREPLTMGKQLVNFITCGCESSAPFFVIYKAGHCLKTTSFPYLVFFQIFLKCQFIYNLIKNLENKNQTHNIVLQSCKYLPRLAQMSLVLKQEHVLLHNLSEYKILKFSMRKDAKNIIFICED